MSNEGKRDEGLYFNFPIQTDPTLEADEVRIGNDTYRLTEAQVNIDRAFAIVDQIIAILTEEHMSARTAADEKAKNAPEVEAAAADIATFYRYLTTHGVDKETAKELTCRYQADQFNQAYVARAEAFKPAPATPVAEASEKQP